MKEIGYSKSTYWHDLYRKIQIDTHWTDTQMGDNLPDVCKYREQETIDNLVKDGALTVAKSVMDIDKENTPIVDVNNYLCDLSRIEGEQINFDIIKRVRIEASNINSAINNLSSTLTHLTGKNHTVSSVMDAMDNMGYGKAVIQVDRVMLTYELDIC